MISKFKQIPLPPNKGCWHYIELFRTEFVYWKIILMNYNKNWRNTWYDFESKLLVYEEILQMQVVIDNLNISSSRDSN